MGRRKITIERIKDDRNRHITFLKRSSGLLKKAMELSLLCDSEVALVFIDDSGRATTFASSGSLNETVDRLTSSSVSEAASYNLNDYGRFLSDKNDEEIDNLDIGSSTGGNGKTQSLITAMLMQGGAHVPEREIAINKNTPYARQYETEAPLCSGPRNMIPKRSRESVSSDFESFPTGAEAPSPRNMGPRKKAVHNVVDHRLAPVKPGYVDGLERHDYMNSMPVINEASDTEAYRAMKKRGFEQFNGDYSHMGMNPMANSGARYMPPGRPPYYYGSPFYCDERTGLPNQSLYYFPPPNHMNNMFYGMPNVDYPSNPASGYCADNVTSDAKPDFTFNAHPMKRPNGGSDGIPNHSGGGMERISNNNINNGKPYFGCDTVGGGRDPSTRFRVPTHPKVELGSSSEETTL